MTAQYVGKCTSRRALFHPSVVVSVHGHVGDREWLWCPWCEIQLSNCTISVPNVRVELLLTRPPLPPRDWASMRPEVSQLDVPVAVYDKQFGSDDGE